jgi:hypothetical protein
LVYADPYGLQKIPVGAHPELRREWAIDYIVDGVKKPVTGACEIVAEVSQCVARCVWSTFLGNDLETYAQNASIYVAEAEIRAIEYFGYGAKAVGTRVSNVGLSLSATAALRCSLSCEATSKNDVSILLNGER